MLVVLGKLQLRHFIRYLFSHLLERGANEQRRLSVNYIVLSK